MVHEHDHECGCGHHHHDEDTEHLHTNKYQQAFAKFEAAGTTEEVTGRVKTLLGKHGNDNFTPDVLKQIHGFIDLTSLTSIDTKESIWKLVDKVNDFEGTRPDVPNVAAICTYPLFVETVKEALSAQEVKIASVAGGFPSSQTFMEIKIAETAMAVMQGADEIDVVMNLGYFLEENYDELSEEIQEIKESCRDAKLKVILETGAPDSRKHSEGGCPRSLFRCGLHQDIDRERLSGSHSGSRLHDVPSLEKVPFHHGKTCRY